MLKNLFIVICLLLPICLFPIAGKSQYWIQSGGSATIDEGLAICTDSNDNVYTTGYFTSVFSMNGQQLISQGMEDIFISKMNSTGVLNWLISAGGPNPERALSIDADNSGNIVVTGYFYGSITFGTTQLISQGQQDIFIAKYNSSGTLLWARQAGGINSDLGNTVKFDNAGNVIVAGEFSGSCSFNTTTLVSLAGSIDAFITKYDANGNLLWAKKGSGQYSDRGTGIAIDLQNNVYVSGMFSDTITFDAVHPNTMMNSAFVIKLNSNGNEQWFRWLGSGTSISSGGINYSSNGINITGNFSGQIIFLGSSTSTTINPILLHNIYIGRINVTGNLEFLTSDGSDSEVSSTAVTSKSNGDIIVAGNFKCKFKDYATQYGAGVFCSVGYEDNFVVSYSSIGNWQWARQFGGQQRDVINGITMRNDSIPVFTGSYSGNYFVPVVYSQITSHGTLYVDYDIQSASVNFCNDPAYGDYVKYFNKGNSDVFINSAINLSREPLDYFIRSAGPCVRDFKSLCMTSANSSGNCVDTSITCTADTLSFDPANEPSAVYNFFNAPDFNFNWSNGSTYGMIVVAATNQYHAVATTIDGCFSYSDSIYLIGTFQPPPALADNKGFNTGSTTPTTVLLCDPDSAELSCLNQGTSSISWSGFPSGMSPVTVNTSNLYVCTLTNPYGCSRSTEIEVVVKSPLSSAIQPKLKWLEDLDGDDSLTICQNDTFKVFLYDELSNPGGNALLCVPEMSFSIFSVDPTSGNYSYMFATTCNNLVNPFIALNSGDFNVIITAEVVRVNPCGNDTTFVTDTLYLHVNPSNVGTLNFTITGPDEFCPGSTAALIASPSQYSYIWSNASVGDTLFVNQPGVYSATGSYVVINPFGCPDSLIGIVFDTIAYYAQPTVFVVPSSGIICPNDSVLLQCPGPVLTDWYGPAGALATNTNAIYSNIPGNYYCYQTMDSMCVLLSNTVSLTQFSSPSIQALPSTICTNGTSTLNILASPGSLIQWQPPLSGSSPVQFVSTAGTYYCDVTSCGSTSNLSVTINNHPPISTPAISFIAPDLVSTPASGYQWYLNGFPIPSANAQTLTPVQQGTYTVQVTDTNGCTALSDPFVFTSLNENSIQSYLQIVPNPASTFIQIRVSNPELNLKEVSAIIRNIQGQILMKEQISEDLKINIEDISNSIYFLELVSKSIVYKKKFVILK